MTTCLTVWPKCEYFFSRLCQLIFTFEVLSSIFQFNLYLFCSGHLIRIIKRKRKTINKKLYQTPRKLWSFHRTEGGFWPDFVDFKHDYAHEFYRSYSVFTGKCPRTGKFRGVCFMIQPPEVEGRSVKENEILKCFDYVFFFFFALAQCNGYDF